MRDDSRDSQTYSFRACKTNEHQSVNKLDITFENQFDCMYHVTGFQIIEFLQTSAKVSQLLYVDYLTDVLKNFNP